MWHKGSRSRSEKLCFLSLFRELESILCVNVFPTTVKCLTEAGLPGNADVLWGAGEGALSRKHYFFTSPQAERKLFLFSVPEEYI